MAHRRESSMYGSGVPSSVIPEFIGQIYYDTTNMKYYGSRSKNAGDWVLLGDMLKSVYDTDDDSKVDNAEQLNDGINIVTALEARSHIEDITIHGGGSNIFGAEFQYAESNSVSVSTSTTFINKVNLTTTNLPAGKYKVEVSYGWNHDSVGNDFEARVVLDNNVDINDLIFLHVQEGNEAGGNGLERYNTTGTDQNLQYSGFKYITLSAGIHNLKLDFRTSHNSDESSIWDATISITRVI